jgi:hypothetical protein
MARDLDLRGKVTVDGADKAAKELEDVADSAKKIEGETFKAKVDVDTGDAKSKLDDLAGDVQTLDGKDAQVNVDADTAAATAGLGEVEADVAGLEGEAATVAVDADTEDAAAGLDDVQGDVDDLDGAAATVAVDADTEEASAGLESLKGQLEELAGQSTVVNIATNFSSAISSFGSLKEAAQGAFSFISQNAGAIAGAGVAGLGAAVTAFAVKAVGDFQDAALGAGRLSDALGLTTEDASRWVEVAGDVGVSAQSIETAFGKVLLAIGKSPPGGVFGDLAAKSKGGGIDINETILNVIDHLNQIENPSIRAAEAQKLLGKGWRDAAELIEQGSDKVRASLAAVGKSKIMDEGDTAQAREFRDNLDDLADSAEEFSLAVGNLNRPTPGLLTGSTRSPRAPRPIRRRPPTTSNVRRSGSRRWRPAALPCPASLTRWRTPKRSSPR